MDGFEAIPLQNKHLLWAGALPAALTPDAAAFEALWALHPAEFHVIQMHGRPVKTPRWQQAYGRDYHYTGRVNRALPVEGLMAPFLAWAQEAICADLNGLLFNWYDGAQGHYIGKHRDSTRGLRPGAPIVTISLGEERVFRLRPWKGHGIWDFPMPHGSVLVLPWDTNLAWTHEVPAAARYRQRRISITARAFL
jgi:alkylated DNA repair dioxygenase AlkB